MPKILIVDDIEDNRYLLKRRLKRFGFDNCVEADNGFKAIELVRDEVIDLVFLDLMMPGMDGFEVLTELRNLQLLDNLPVIMISAADDLENVAKGIELGAEDYLSKPFNPTILKARTDAALEKRARALDKIQTAQNSDIYTGLPNASGMMADSKNWDSYQSVKALQVQFVKYTDIYNSFGVDGATQYLRAQINKLTEFLNDSALCQSPALYRMTYDSVAITMPNVSDEAVFEISEHIIRTLSGQFTSDTISVLEEVRVAATVTDEVVAASELNRQLASAMSGTSLHQPFAVYQDDAQSVVLERIYLEADLRRAIDQRELEVYFQPQVAVATGAVVSAEALVRWPHPERGMISPGQFIPIAEQAGLISDLGVLVTSLTLEALQNLDTLQKAVPISINIASEHFLEPTFEQEITRLLGSYPSHLTALIKLELTESTFLDDKALVNRVMSSLKNQGMKISLDDFGTGYSSLSYLFQLPIDQLKIDKSFVDALELDNRAQSILSHIIALAHDLDFEVVVEGVETQEQLNWVSASGADLIQGYFYYKPLPYKDFIDVL